MIYLGGRRDRMVVDLQLPMQSDLQLPMQSVPITTKAVISNTTHGEVYLIHYMVKLVMGFLHQ
jgi:hypothetical protein